MIMTRAPYRPEPPARVGRTTDGAGQRVAGGGAIRPGASLVLDNRLVGDQSSRGAARHPVSGAPLALRLSLELWAVIFLLALNMIAVLALGANVDRASRISATATEVRSAIDAVDRSVVEQEAAMRGYVISGTASFLAPYDRGADQQRQQSERLVTMLRHEGLSTAPITTADQIMATWRAQVGDPEIAAVRRADGSAGELVRSGAGMALLQRAQSELDVLRSEVNRHTAGALAQVGTAQDRTVALMIGTIVLTGLLVVLRVVLTVLQVSRPLTRLVDEVSAVADGDLDRPVPTGGVPELRRLSRAVESMRLRLLAERTAAARSGLLEGQEQERRRVASGLHDDTVQAAVAANLRLSRLRRHLAGTDAKAAALVDEAANDLHESITRMRRVVFELHPPTLDEEGLESAMRLYLKETATPSGVHWSVTGSAPEQLDHASRTLAYRLFREAVANAVKHAGAQRIDVTLTAAGDELEVVVADDGAGFDTGVAARPRPGHLGLTSSVRLAEASGGRWSVTSAPGSGSRVTYAVPVRYS
jgi:signal transduction histidine kinase